MLIVHLHLHRWSAVVACLLGCAFASAAENEPVSQGGKSFFEGYELYQKGFFKDAIPFLERSIKESPSHAPAFARLADCYEKLGRYTEAAPLWQRYIILRPSQAERIKNHAELLQSFSKAECLLNDYSSATDKDQKQKLWQEAEPLLTAAAQDKYTGSVIADKAITLLLPRLIEQEKFTPALELCKRLQREFPQSLTPQTTLLWGTCLRGTGAWLDAISVLERAEKEFKDDPVKQKECRRELALSHMGIADALIKAGKNLPAREVLTTLRGKYLSSLSPEEMLQAQRLIMLCEGRQVEEWIRSGDQYASQGMYEDALRWYLKVRSLTFSNAYTAQAEERIRAIEGLGRKRLEEIDQLIAKQQFNGAMKLCESMELGFAQEFKVKAMNKYADAAIADKQFELAEKKLFALAQKYPDTEDGALAYGRVGYMRGITQKDPAKGLTVFQSLTKWNEGSRYAQREGQLGVGIMLALLGKKEDATRVLTAVAIEYAGDKRVTELCREYIWKCKNCSEIRL